MNEESVYEDLRAWAQEIDMPIWTVCQINRDGHNSEVLTSRNISECFAKAMIVDLFITMNRDKTGPTPEIGNMFIDLSRLGPDGVLFSMFIDTSKSKIKIMAQDFDTMNNDEGEDKMSKLRQKYIDFSKKKSSSKEAN
jgi:hypothetical protein